MRVGIGYDSHRFADRRKLILGGVTIPHLQGLTGHSDADAVAHALTDAILGAAGLGDIGTMFPPTDPAWRDANSLELLKQAHLRVAEAGLDLNLPPTVEQGGGETGAEDPCRGGDVLIRRDVAPRR